MSNFEAENQSSAAAVAATIYPVRVFFYGETDPDGPFSAQNTPTMDPGKAVRGIAGVGNKYYVYDQDTIGFDWWNGFVIDDWSEASVCSSTIATNQAAIAAQLASPSAKVHTP
jgi:hypothetical protein